MKAQGGRVQVESKTLCRSDRQNNGEGGGGGKHMNPGKTDRRMERNLIEYSIE